MMIHPTDVKRGDEPFHANGLDCGEVFRNATVADFWRWGYSRLMADGTRGVLAEFIVANLVGSDMQEPGSPDREYDLKTPTGRTVSVKSSAYLQDWPTRKPRTDSDIKFSHLQCKLFDSNPSNPEYGPKRYQAELFVFCVLTTRDAASINPLDLAQWQFYVLTRSSLEAIGSPDSVGLNRLRTLTEACSWTDLRHRVGAAELTLPQYSPSG